MYSSFTKYLRLQTASGPTRNPDGAAGVVGSGGTHAARQTECPVPRVSGPHCGPVELEELKEDVPLRLKTCLREIYQFQSLHSSRLVPEHRGAGDATRVQLRYSL